MSMSPESISLTSLMYDLSEEDYKQIVYKYCNDNNLTHIDVDKDFCTKFLNYLMKYVSSNDAYSAILDKQLEERMANCYSYIYDKNTKKFMEVDFGGHCDILSNYLREHFKFETPEDKQRVMKYCQDSLIIKGALWSVQNLIVSSIENASGELFWGGKI
jgi:hypothetical protein